MINRVGIMARQQTKSVASALNSLINYLKTLKVKIVVEDETAKFLPPVYASLPHVSRSELGKRCSLLLVVGGDGSLLSAGRDAAKQNLPILGINLGKLGFLTDVLPTKLKSIEDILRGQSSKEYRFLLEAVVCKPSTETSTRTRSQQNQTKLHYKRDIALNDIVILAETSGRMFNFALYLDGNFVCNYRADGLIVSTPTGSTAHALAGGGPIVYPSLDALSIIPMFSHNLSSRPIVVSANGELTIVPESKQSIPLKAVCDGQNEIKVERGEAITIKKANEKLCLVHPNDYNYFEALRIKLGWES